MVAAASMMPATVTTLPVGTQLPSATATAQAAGAAGTLNQNDFLTLLTTQLEHQDPLNPQSPSDFAAELAQFTTASGVQSLNTTLGTGSGLQAASLVGQNVAVAGNTLVLGSNGAAAQGAFSLSGAASDARVFVADSTGSIVAAMDLGAMAAGAQNFTWNGKAADGSSLPAGAYSYQIVAAAASGAAPTVTSFAVVPVTSVVLGGQNGPTLNLGGGLAPVALSAVQQVF